MKEDQGEYQCRVRNYAGWTASDEASSYMLKPNWSKNCDVFYILICCDEWLYDQIMILIVYKNGALVTLEIGPNADQSRRIYSTKTNSYVCEP